MNKTNTAKNKSARVNIEWPTSHFTIEDVQNKYPDAVNITLRFRVKKAEEAKEIVLIGKIKPAIGRPRKVYTTANPSKEVREAARLAGVISVESDNSTVSVAEVKATKKAAQNTDSTKTVVVENVVANQTSS